VLVPVLAVGGFFLYRHFQGSGDEADAAIRHATEAIEQNDNDPTAYIARGDLHLDKHDPDRALEDYNRAIDLDGKDAWAYKQRGLAYQQTGDVSRAIEDLEASLKLDANPESKTETQVILKNLRSGGS
jgi:tetratricopeptide (TPR) repeat protein